MFLECRKLIQSENTFLLTFQFFILVKMRILHSFIIFCRGGNTLRCLTELEGDLLIIRFPETLWNQRRHELVFQVNRECDAFGF